MEWGSPFYSSILPFFYAISREPVKVCIKFDHIAWWIGPVRDRATRLFIITSLFTRRLDRFGTNNTHCPIRKPRMKPPPKIRKKWKKKPNGKWWKIVQGNEFCGLFRILSIQKVDINNIPVSFVLQCCWRAKVHGPWPLLFFGFFACCCLVRRRCCVKRFQNFSRRNNNVGFFFSYRLRPSLSDDKKRTKHVLTSRPVLRVLCLHNNSSTTK